MHGKAQAIFTIFGKFGKMSKGSFYLLFRTEDGLNGFALGWRFNE
jgi:hypothetical protein